MDILPPQVTYNSCTCKCLNQSQEMTACVTEILKRMPVYLEFIKANTRGLWTNFLPPVVVLNSLLPGH